MANHPSAAKRARASEVKRKRNRARKTAMKMTVKKFRANKDAKSASEQFPKIASLLDKLARKGLIHKNKAANLKSKLARHIQKISAPVAGAASSVSSGEKIPGASLS